MSAFHLWHPAYVLSDPLTLECFVTLGESLLLAEGTDAFVGAALRAMRIEEPPRSWTMQPVRTHYFSSYRQDSHHWEDRWNLAWRLRLVLDPARPPAVASPPPWGYFDVDEIDASFHPMRRPQLASGWHCLLIADAVEHSVLESGRHSILEGFPLAECAWGKAFGVYPQLRCDLGYFEATYYEQGAPAVEDVLRRLEAGGVSVHHADLQDAIVKRKRSSNDAPRDGSAS